MVTMLKVTMLLKVKIPSLLLAVDDDAKTFHQSLPLQVLAKVFHRPAQNWRAQKFRKISTAAAGLKMPFVAAGGWVVGA